MTELRVSGRPAALQTWGQIKADVLGIPVSRVAGDATAPALRCSRELGVGLYSSPEAAMATACRRDSPIEPDAANHERYEAIYEQYRDVAASPTLRVPSLTSRVAPGETSTGSASMNVKLGINTCFALKRWPRPADWASVVRNDLGLEFVELSLDLIEGTDTFAGAATQSSDTCGARCHGLRAHATFTGLAAYSLDLLMHPDATRRESALDWYRTSSISPLRLEHRDRRSSNTNRTK